MAETTAQQIIAVALGTHATHPRAPVMDVLDLAMRGHEGCDLSFEAKPSDAFDDWLDPPPPFADLLREALAPDSTAEQTALWHSDDLLPEEDFRELWDGEPPRPVARVHSSALVPYSAVTSFMFWADTYVHEGMGRTTFWARISQRL